MENPIEYNNCYNENYLCDICDREFTNFSKFLSHSSQKHGIPEDEISYDCANCYQSFTMLTNFQQHIVKKGSNIYKITDEILFIKDFTTKCDDSDSTNNEFDNEKSDNVL